MGPVGCADEVILSRKGAKSRARITGLRSKTTKATTDVDRLRSANTDLKKKLAEALEQQTATSEVLRVISSSPGELEPVFTTMLGNAARICEAKFGTLWLCEGETFRFVAQHNAPTAWVAKRQEEPVFRPHPESGLGRLLLTKQVTHIPDIRTTQAYIERDPGVVVGVELAGYRTALAVPMLKENELIGAFSIHAKRFYPSPRSRSHWCRTSPPKPLSPSRTPACSTSCVKACSSRPPPPTCSR